MRQGYTSLRVNDQVEVIAGKDKGRVGKILKVDKQASRAVVERINMIKRHLKPTDATKAGQILEKEASVHISNLMLICPACGPVRIARKVETVAGKTRRVRVCRKCGATLDK